MSKMKILEKEVADQYLYAGAALVGLPLAVKAVKVLSKPRVKEGKFKGVPVPAGSFDVIVVGGGPSGSTLAYFYSKVSAVRAARGAAAERAGGRRSARCCSAGLLKKAHFPRARASLTQAAPPARLGAAWRCWRRRPFRVTSTAVRR